MTPVLRQIARGSGDDAERMQGRAVRLVTTANLGTLQLRDKAAPQARQKQDHDQQKGNAESQSRCKGFGKEPS